MAIILPPPAHGKDAKVTRQQQLRSLTTKPRATSPSNTRVVTPLTTSTTTSTSRPVSPASNRPYSAVKSKVRSTSPSSTKRPDSSSSNPVIPSLQLTPRNLSQSASATLKLTAPSKPGSSIGWSKGITNTVSPNKRYRHASAVLGTKLYVFGGNSGTCLLDDLVVLDLIDLRWRTLSLPNAPSAREGHSLSTVGDLLVLFGGETANECSNEVFIFDTIEEKWTPLTIKGQSPYPRCGHSVTTLGDKLVLFGGADRKSSVPLFFQDTWIFNVVTQTWTDMNCHGLVPCKRYGHSLTSVNGRIVLFGGYGVSGRTNDCWEFDIVSASWKYLNIIGTVPHKRSEHGATCVSYMGGACMVVYGGRGGSGLLQDLWVLQLEDGISWKQLETSCLSSSRVQNKTYMTSHFPRARQSHTVTSIPVIDPKDTSYKLLVFGGLATEAKPLSDVWILNIGSQTDELFSPRFPHTASHLASIEAFSSSSLSNEAQLYEEEEVNQSDLIEDEQVISSSTTKISSEILPTLDIDSKVQKAVDQSFSDVSASLSTKLTNELTLLEDRIVERVKVELTSDLENIITAKIQAHIHTHLESVLSQVKSMLSPVTMSSPIKTNELHFKSFEESQFIDEIYDHKVVIDESIVEKSEIYETEIQVEEKTMIQEEEEAEENVTVEEEENVKVEEEENVMVEDLPIINSEEPEQDELIDNSEELISSTTEVVSQHVSEVPIQIPEIPSSPQIIQSNLIEGKPIELIEEKPVELIELETTKVEVEQIIEQIIEEHDVTEHDSVDQEGELFKEEETIIKDSNCLSEEQVDSVKEIDEEEPLEINLDDEISIEDVCSVNATDDDPCFQRSEQDFDSSSSKPLHQQSHTSITSYDLLPDAAKGVLSEEDFVAKPDLLHLPDRCIAGIIGHLPAPFLTNLINFALIHPTIGKRLLRSPHIAHGAACLRWGIDLVDDALGPLGSVGITSPHNAITLLSKWCRSDLNFKEGKCTLRSLSTSSDEPVGALAVSCLGVGGLVYSGGANTGTVNVWAPALSKEPVLTSEPSTGVTGLTVATGISDYDVSSTPSPLLPELILTCHMNGEMKSWVVEGDDSDLIDDEQIQSYVAKLKLTCVSTLALHHTEIQSMALHQDFSGRDLLATSGKDRTVRLWDLRSLYNSSSSSLSPLCVFSSQRSQFALTFAPPYADSVLACGGGDKVIKLYDLSNPSTENQICKLSGHTGKVRALSFVDRSLLVSGASDGCVAIWDTRIGKAVAAFPDQHTGSVRSVSTRAGGYEIVSGSTDGALCGWDVRGSPAKCLHVVKFEEPVTSLDVGVCRVIAGGEKGSIKCFDFSANL
ncbi:hypothetical protein RCL1_001441 [Eukaryota sp. TZLM3-RCL]